MDLQKVHVIIVLLTDQSHCTPLTDFGILVSQRGIQVTIITTLCNVIRYKPTVDCANSSFNLNIKLLTLDGSCQGDDEMVLRRSLEKLMEVLVPQPSCIVSGQIPQWPCEIACIFNIPFYGFIPISCFSALCGTNIFYNKLHESLDSFLVPEIPHEIKLKASQLPGFAARSKGTQKGTEKKYPMRGVLVNSFEELEPWYLGQYKVLHYYLGIGPVSLCHKENLMNKTSRGQKASVDAKLCLDWLGAMKQGSVIYACFGSLTCITPSQSIEIGLGLESSNRPFIWVIRDTKHSAKIKEWLELTKFETRVQGRGLVIRGWAPQLVILSHPSIGGFFTHCGWNSTLEGVCAGVPMITWPMINEQFFNERFVIDVLKIGLKIGVEDMYSSKEVMVKSERVTEAIIELMDGEEADERRKRANELGVLANKTLKEGGASHSNINFFIQDVMQFISKQKECTKMSTKKMSSSKKNPT